MFQFQGQDQVLDVELDKSTILKSPQLGYVPLGSKSLWNMAVTSSSSPAVASEIGGELQSEMVEQEKAEGSIEEDVFELSNGGYFISFWVPATDSQPYPNFLLETRSILARVVKQFPMTLDSED